MKNLSVENLTNLKACKEDSVCKELSDYTVTTLKVV